MAFESIYKRKQNNQDHIVKKRASRFSIKIVDGYKNVAGEYIPQTIIRIGKSICDKHKLQCGEKIDVLIDVEQNKCMLKVSDKGFSLIKANSHSETLYLKFNSPDEFSSIPKKQSFDLTIVESDDYFLIFEIPQ